MDKTPRLKNIITAAPGWYAVFWKESAPYYTCEPIAVWGLFAQADYPDDSYNFCDAVRPGVDGYEAVQEVPDTAEVYWHESEINDELRAWWVKESKDFFERQKGKWVKERN